MVEDTKNRINSKIQKDAIARANAIDDSDRKLKNSKAYKEMVASQNAQADGGTELVDNADNVDSMSPFIPRIIIDKSQQGRYKPDTNFVVEEKKPYRIQVTMSKQNFDYIKAKAERTGTTMSSVCAIIIDDVIQERLSNKQKQ